MDARDAYEILGLKDQADKDQIVKRYDILFKRYKLSKQGGENAPSFDMDINEINKAYNLLMGYGNEDEVVKEAPNPTLQKVGLDSRKVKNFFHYYKFHIVGIIIALFVVGSLVKSFVTYTNPDLNVAFLGNFMYDTSGKLADEIKQELGPAVKDVGIDGASIGGDENNSVSAAMFQKAMIILSAQDVDVIIADKFSFDRYAPAGAFVSLDALRGEVSIDDSRNKQYILKTEDDIDEHIYGIDVSNSAFLKKAGVLGDQKIAVISVRSKNRENANEFLKLLLK